MLSVDTLMLPGFPELIDEMVNGRELDQPCYNGRYCVSANNSGHSTTSNDRQQERQLTTVVCEGFFEHPADLEKLD